MSGWQKDQIWQQKMWREVNDLNFMIQQLLPGNLRSFKSVDAVCDTNEAVNYPAEYLNSLDLPGMAMYHLQLKLEVSEELGINQSVISRLWQRFQHDGNMSRCNSTGRPRVTTPNEDRQTVYRRLGYIGLHAGKLVRCVPLTATHCRLRLSWSREHALWTPQQWSCVMFSNESRFSLQFDSHRTLIWRVPGTRYHQENTIERHHYGGAGWLVWGGIILGSRSDLHVQSVTMIIHIYRDVNLEQHVRLFRSAMVTRTQVGLNHQSFGLHSTALADYATEARKTHERKKAIKLLNILNLESTFSSTIERGAAVAQWLRYRIMAARKKLTDVYGEGVLTVRQYQNWFAKFRSGNFDVEDAPRSGRPVEADKDAIKALVDVNRRITTREIGLRLNLSNSTVYDHLKGLGLSSKLDVWVPHILTERNLCRRIDVCNSLLKRHENDPFLKRIITGDEKGHGAKKMNRLKQFPKPIFTKKADAVCLVGF
ncbi:histone-lysine N-methyltransferase SETMAR [Trichonephila clavipes]|nr:histone-lysine N-methyltransferase SETMAR [Trichonephila clavipes]